MNAESLNPQEDRFSTLSREITELFRKSLFNFRTLHNLSAAKETFNLTSNLLFNLYDLTLDPSSTPKMKEEYEGLVQGYNTLNVLLNGSNQESSVAIQGVAALGTPHTSTPAVIGVDATSASSVNSEPRTENEITAEIERNWGIIVSSETPTKGAKASEQNRELRVRILDLASRLPDAETESKKWKTKLNILDGFTTLAGPDVFVELASPNSELVRSKLGGEVDINDIREYLSLPEIKPVLEMAQNIFFAGTVRFVDLAGNPLQSPHSPRPDKLMVDADGNPYEHNYGRSGNPNDQDINSGKKLTFYDYLTQLTRNLNIPKSDLQAIQMVVVLGELRHKAEVVYYADYSETPKTFDLKPIEQAATMSWLLYKIRSGGYVRPEYWRFFGSVSFPTFKTEGSRSPDAVGYPREFAQEEGLVSTLWEKTKEVLCEEPEAILRYLHPDVPDAIKGRMSSRAKFTPNIRDAIEAREIADDLVTSIDMPRVELPIDFQQMPMLWDILSADERSAYQQINFQKYEEICAAWLKFTKQIEHTPNINGKADIVQAINEAIGSYSANKGMIEAIEGINHSGPYKEVYRQCIQYLFLRYTKDLFDQFNLLARFGDEIGRRNIFVEIAKTQYRIAGTVPPFVREYMLKALDYVTMNNLKVVRLTFSNPEEAKMAKDMKTLFSSQRPVRAKYESNTSVAFRSYYAEAAEKANGEDKK